MEFKEINTQMKMIYTCITPEIAANLLENNFENRTLSKGTVQAYAQDILAGNWDEFVGTAISLDENDIIRDGQHRLTAIVHTGVPVKTWVCLNVAKNLERGGADVVIEVAGAEDTFQLAWQCARPNAIVTIVALYDKPQVLPLPDMYGKNLTFKTGGVDGCDCAEILSLIEEGKIDTTPLITHRFPLTKIAEAYRLFENNEDGVIKVAIDCITE